MNIYLRPSKTALGNKFRAFKGARPWVGITFFLFGKLSASNKKEATAMFSQETAFTITAGHIAQYGAYFQEQERGQSTVKKYVHIFIMLLFRPQKLPYIPALYRKSGFFTTPLPNLNTKGPTGCFSALSRLLFAPIIIPFYLLAMKLEIPFPSRYNIIKIKLL